MRPRTVALLSGSVIGVLVGLSAARRWSAHNRANLYSSRPWRRWAALGALAQRPGAETVRLLRDYLGWERVPRLRRRAHSLLGRLEAALG